MIRRSWHFLKGVAKVVFRHPLPGTNIVPLLPDGRIAFIRRRDTGKWGLPGGLIDWGETIASTAKRELMEETGLELVKIRRLVGVYSAVDRDPRIHSVCILVEVEAKGTFQVRDSAEIIEVKAFSRDKIPFGNLCHDHDRQLHDYFTGKTILA